MYILITAGGTREYIDPVRFISNASSGKMGYALARAALKAGHKVTLITAPTTQRPPDVTKIVNVETTAEMCEAAKKFFDRCDCLIMAAAVADYTVIHSAKTKLKKSDTCLTIELKPTPDILEWAGKNKKAKGKRKIVVGFALEDKAVCANAEKKLRDKNLDMIIANSPAAIGSDRSDVHIKIPDSPWIKIENAAKAATARMIVALAEKLHAAKLK
ncbi:MAG: phosphopantothenoylcysteine decarboxylase [Phycisphaerales bacterium]|nr:MAG: phosphopantothenoylcysteine decarboxylase [Phycisphaerales bacterium]